MRVTNALLALLATSTFAAPLVDIVNSGGGGDHEVSNTDDTSEGSNSAHGGSGGSSSSSSNEDQSGVTTNDNAQGGGDPTKVKPADSGTACSKRGLFGLFIKRTCQDADEAADPPYVNPDPQTLTKFLDDMGKYVDGDMNHENNLPIWNFLGPYLIRPPVKDGTLLYTTAGKDSAQTQNDNTARNNVGDAYGGYNKKLFDPGNEPMKSIYARNDPDFTHKFWEATSVYYVKRSSGIIAMMTDLLPAALSAAKGGNGKPAIFVSSENPAALQNPDITGIVLVKPPVGEVLTQGTGPTIATIAPWLAKGDSNVLQGIANGGLPGMVLWDRSGQHGPTSWP